MPDRIPSTFVRNFIFELILYGISVVAFFVVVRRLMGDWLIQLFTDNLVLYAIISLILVVVHGVFLDIVTSLLLRRVKLERLE